MKKLFAFLLACVCALALFGCAGANDDKSDGGPEDDWAPLTEAQRTQLVFGERACQMALNLPAVLGGARLDELPVDAVVAIHKRHSLLRKEVLMVMRYELNKKEY